MQDQADSLYSESPGGDTSTSDNAEGTDSQDDPSKTDQNQDGEAQTFLVSKDSLGGSDPQPGDVCEFKCVRLHDDEAEFEYVKSDNENKEPSSPEKDKANQELDSMAA